MLGAILAVSHHSGKSLFFRLGSEELERLNHLFQGQDAANIVTGSSDWNLLHTRRQFESLQSKLMLGC